MAEDMEADLRLIGTMVAQWADNDQFDAWERILSAHRKMVEALEEIMGGYGPPCEGCERNASIARAALTGSREQ